MTAARDRLIFALDVDDEGRARALVSELSPYVGTFKVGLELLMRGGVALLDRLLAGMADSAGVFVDAKLHDVPATVTRAMRQIVASRCAVRFVTVHDGVREAVAAAEGRAGVLLVSVLTSVDGLELGGPEALRARVLGRAQRAVEQGAAGIVCSPREARAVREIVPEGFAVVTPGLRPLWASVPGDDQRRTATVAEALQAGATHVVVGRPIRDAKSPAEAARRVLEEIVQAIEAAPRE